MDVLLLFLAGMFLGLVVGVWVMLMGGLFEWWGR
jgi:hypothetical protein